LPYIPSGSFAKAMLIEGADANASVTGNESTVPMQLRITGLVEMPNSKTYDATGCFVDPLSRAMYSSDGPDFEFVQQKRREGLSIHEAVWQLAWKKSGPEMASLEAWLEEHEKYRSVA
ncbi:hypothetical protein OM298_23055, partial [Escherichia albertii]|nr:hypothetical protein [Escherichia albertii]